MSWQNIRQSGEAEHAGDSKEHLGQELGILCAPLTSLCRVDGTVIERQERLTPRLTAGLEGL